MILCGAVMTFPLLVRRAGRVPDIEEEVYSQGLARPVMLICIPFLSPPHLASLPDRQGYCIPEGLCQGLLILCTVSGAPVNLV